jgi:tRNA(Ile)-lysidine synthase
MAEPVPAEAGAVWDGRFRLDGPGLPGAELGALGAAPGLQRPAWLPAAVARTLPALRHNGTLVAVAGLFYPGPISAEAFRITFAPGGGPLP